METKSSGILIVVNNKTDIFDNEIVKYSKLLYDLAKKNITIKKIDDKHKFVSLSILKIIKDILYNYHKNNAEPNINNYINNQEFNNVNDYNYINIILTADLLQIKLIKNLFIKQLTSIIKNSVSTNDLRTKLNIVSDFEEYEEKEIENENNWSNNKKIEDLAAFSIIIENKQHNNINDISKSIKKRKLIKPVEDNTTIGCTKCNTSFTTLNRRHHCRKCGRIFCSKCSNKEIDIPENEKALLPDNIHINVMSIVNKHIYNSEKERVCNDCYNSILNERSYYDMIELLNIIGLDIYLLKRVGSLNSVWRKAVIYVMSNYREIQYKLTTNGYTKNEKRMIWNNRYNYIGHSIWLIQLIKSINFSKLDNDKLCELIKIIESNDKKHDCYHNLCSSICNNTIQPCEALFLLNQNITNERIRNYAINCLNKCNDNELLCYLPILIHYIRYDSIDNTKLLEFLFTRAARNQIICNDIYWALSVNSESKEFKCRYDIIKQKLTVDVMKINNNDNTIIDDLLNGVKFMEIINQNNDINTIKSKLQSIKTSFTSPINNNIKIKNIIFDKVYSKQSATAPIIIPFIDDNDDKHNLMFKKEDIRKDYIIINIINLLHIILKNNNINIPLISYRAIPTSSVNGFIEMVNNCETLYDILNKGSINNFLQNHNEETSIGSLTKQYTESLAFWTVITHLLGIGDRHLENIMLTHDGILFHVDYGFIIGHDSKPLTPNIRISDQILDAIGGSDNFTKFKNICSKIFIVLRKYFNLIHTMLSLLIDSDPPILKFSNKYLEDQIASRFFIGQSDKEAQQAFELLIDNCRNNIAHQVSDYFHQYSKTSPLHKNVMNIASSVSKTMTDTVSSTVSNTFKWFFK